MPKKGLKLQQFFCQYIQDLRILKVCFGNKRNMFDNFQLFWTFQSYFFLNLTCMTSNRTVNTIIKLKLVDSDLIGH